MVKNVSLVEIYRFGRERGQVSFLLQKKRTSFLSLTEKEDKFPFSYRKRGKLSLFICFFVFSLWFIHSKKKKQKNVYKRALGGCLGKTIKDVPCNEKLRRGAILFGGPSDP